MVKAKFYLETRNCPKCRGRFSYYINANVGNNKAIDYKKLYFSISKPLRGCFLYKGTFMNNFLFKDNTWNSKKPRLRLRTNSNKKRVISRHDQGGIKVYCECGGFRFFKKRKNIIA